MARSTRNKKLPNKYNDIAAKIVADATKGGRKPKKSTNPTPKTTSKKPTHTGPPDIDDSSPPSAPEPAYTISTSVLWKGKELRPAVMTSKEFDFQKFNAAVIQSVEKKANKKGYRTVLQKAIATLACAGNQRSIDTFCSDESEWRAVDGLARQWLEEKRKGVSIRITHTYGPKEDSSDSESSSEEPPPPPSKKQKKNEISDEESSSNDSSDSGFSTPSESDQRKKKKKQKKEKENEKTLKSGSATARQIAHAKKANKLDKQLGFKGYQLMQRWECQKPGCPGRTHYCWQPDGPGGKHYILRGEQISKWNKAMARDYPGVSVETPPLSIQQQLTDWWDKAQTAKAADKEVKSGTKDVQTVPDTPTAASAPISISLNGLNTPTPPAPGYNSFQPQPFPGYTPYSPYQPMIPLQPSHYFPQQQYQPFEPRLPARLPSPTKLPSRPSTADRVAPQVLQPPSSPVRVEGDAGELRRAYFAWQIQKNPSEEAAFTDALDKIEAEGYTLKQLRRMPVSEWKEIGVPKGLAARLKDEVKDFAEQQRNQAAAMATATANAVNRGPTLLDTLADAALLGDQDIDLDSEEDSEEEEDE